MKLCVDSELVLRQVLQDPLHGFSQWSQVVSQVLESSAEVSEFSHVAMLVQNIQVGTAHCRLLLILINYYSTRHGEMCLLMCLKLES